MSLSDLGDFSLYLSVKLAQSPVGSGLWWLLCHFSCARRNFNSIPFCSWEAGMSAPSPRFLEDSVHLVALGKVQNAPSFGAGGWWIKHCPDGATNSPLQLLLVQLMQGAVPKSSSCPQSWGCPCPPDTVWCSFSFQTSSRHTWGVKDTGGRRLGAWKHQEKRARVSSTAKHTNWPGPDRFCSAPSPSVQSREGGKKE